MPLRQLGEEFGRVGQALPQAPQLERSALRFTSQPFAALASQSS